MTQQRLELADPDPGTIEWAQSQVAEYAARREGYVLLGSVLEEVLNHAAAEYAPLAIVTVRAKSIPSFAEKCLRKSHKYRRPVDQLTDLCGGRIIVHTQAQVERISRFLEAHFEIDWANSEDIGRRLKTSEFGYQSVHYIVTFKPGVFPTRGVPVKVPSRLCGGRRGMKNPRAEVQVRTLLQHAWADIGHDLLYKGGFDAPEVWKREYARLAAMLETADGAIGRVHEAMRRFVSSYSAYLTPEQMDTELRLLEFVGDHDPDNIDLALRIGGIANASERWDVAVAALQPHAFPEEPLVLRELGIAYCGKGRGNTRGALYRRGQRLLEQAAEDPDTGAAALLALAASWRGVDDGRARTGFARAFEALPDDPHALAGYLEYEIALAHDLSPTTAAGPGVATALETCRSRVRAGVDVPGAYLASGFLHLLSGEAYEALDSYAKGLQLSGAGRHLATALDSLQRIQPVAAGLEGHAWAVRLLQLGLAVRHPDKAVLGVVRALATPGAAPPTEPVVMVAGGCDPARAQQFERYRGMLRRGLAEFCGTIIGGGTREGVSGFVGDAAERNPGIRALSYLPRLLPLDASLDPRYSEVRAIDDAGFTPLGPLQAWTDLIAAGIDPAGVRLLGINGGRVSAAEYRIALALGATVALVEDSGREAAKLVPDERWGSSRRLLNLPADAASVRAYVGGGSASLPDDLREAVARDLHAEYRSARVRELRPDEPGLAEWEGLLPEYRESAMLQADDISVKLALVGREAVAGGQPTVFPLPEAEVELLAEMEHGRWVVERLLGGWRWGPVKDVKSRVSPYLVPWDELPEAIREWDRIFIRAVPETLARHGYEVRKKRRGAVADQS
ncbi:MAG: RyR domain-containing protein [Actinomycetota bacterium]